MASGNAEDNQFPNNCVTVVIDVNEFCEPNGITTAYERKNSVCQESAFEDNISDVQTQCDLGNNNVLHQKKNERMLALCNAALLDNDSEISHVPVQTCPLCFQNFSDAESFVNHCKHLHVACINGKYKCPFCGYTSSVIDVIQKHLQTHTLHKPFKCKLCKKAFNQSCGVSQHLKTHNESKEFACHLCNRRYKTASYLSVHFNMKHAQLKPYMCKTCGTCFGHSSNLRTHMRTHTGERPYKCSTCKKTFVQQGHLTTHMRLHTGEKPFKCQYCDASFTHIGNLRQHEVSKHTKKYKHLCGECNKGFIGPSELKRHIVSNHSDISPAKAPKIFLSSPNNTKMDAVNLSD